MPACVLRRQRSEVAAERSDRDGAKPSDISKETSGQVRPVRPEEETDMSVEHVENLITIELPHDALFAIAETPEAVAKELRLAAAIEWYREGRISQDEGAGIAGLSRPDFGSALEAKLRPLHPGDDKAGDTMGLGLDEKAGSARPPREGPQGPSSLGELRHSCRRSPRPTIRDWAAGKGEMPRPRPRRNRADLARVGTHGHRLVGRQASRRVA